MSERELLANAIESREDERLPDSLVLFNEMGNEVYSLVLEEMLPMQSDREWADAT